LSYSRSPAELSAMRALKMALDPKGILNPGKIFD
jgi:FAD/FMN-containing dehydrogenase